MDQIVTVISDILLGAGALGAAVYCGVLAQRLKRFNNLENGVGGAVALLSAQVDDMTRTLDLARKAAGHSSETLTALTERAEAATRKLELMLAALNDLPEVAPVSPPVCCGRGCVRGSAQEQQQRLHRNAVPSQQHQRRCSCW